MKITRESFEKRFRDFTPLSPFQTFVTNDHIEQFFRIYQSYLREESSFKEISPLRVKRGISDSSRFMTEVERRVEELRLWVSAFEAEKLPWADLLAASTLKTIVKFQGKIQRKFEAERHMMRLRKSYLDMRSQRFSLHAFIVALDKIIKRKIEVPPGNTREEFTNLLIAGVMVGTTMITPIEAQHFGPATKSRIRQLIYNARMWDRAHPFDEPDIGLTKWKSSGDEKPRRLAAGKGTGKRRSRGKNKQGRGV
jgi:hypothetical protein